MIDIIDLILNQYLRLFVGIVLIALIIFSLFIKLKNKLKKRSNFKINNNDK
jgi:hypothetical protein|tara:strand:+ start:317 stop:469 length:153 start_codon:yes stop_codon:yes gene_type:complete